MPKVLFSHQSQKSKGQGPVFFSVFHSTIPEVKISHGSRRMLDYPVVTSLFQPTVGGMVKQGEEHIFTVLEVASYTSA